MLIHLHTHSHYSLLDGLGTVDQLIAKAKEQGSTALALTDHGAMYGAIEFYQKCKKADIKPIIGVEAYLAPDDLAERNPKVKPYHIILLAKNNTGYKNLLQLTTIAHLEGFYYKPRIDWNSLEKYSDGLIATSACANGPLSKHLRAGQTSTAKKNLEKLLKIFGRENFYIELQHRTDPEVGKINPDLIKLAREYNVPMIATNDIHYVNPDDDQAQDVLLCIQTKRKQAEKDRMSYLGENLSMADEKDLAQYFADVPEVFENTLKLSEKCNVEIELGKIQLPRYELPSGVTADQELRKLSLQGIQKRYGYKAPADIPANINERLEYELGIIEKTGFAAYFLIVQDLVNWAKNNEIVVGPGRGSAAGSLVSYVTGITNIDPIKYDLLFERFLNPERISMPDIDIDFADTRREEVIQYVEGKYGKDHVAQIITFGTMAARAAVRDVGRVLGMSYGYCDSLAKLIPMFSTLDKALETVEELKNIYQDDPEAQRLIDMAKKVEGLIRHSSTHACAVLITKDPLVHNTPLQYASSDDKTIISQYSMHPVEDLGLLKMDFLGLKNLTILEQAIKIIEATENIRIDLDNLPLDDQKTFDLLQAGQTTGVFQLESGGMKRYLKQLKPTELEDIIAMVSLYRPGPMELIPDYIASKHGRKIPTYLHPKLEPILKSTYGVAIYQEQILKIGRELAGLTYGQADVLRKAVGKKIKSLLDEQGEILINGMVNNGVDKKTAQNIWEFIVPFARYGFNRSHAACYAMIAYQTAYLKSNFPEAFMAALLTADQDNIDRVTIEINECRKMGIEVLPPDVNESFGTFAVVKPKTPNERKKIRFGLNAIKNVGHNIAKVIITERKADGQFRSLEDFLLRIKDKDLNKKSLESLIKAGAFDQLISRGQALGNLNTLLEFHKKIQNDHKNKQNNLFADLPLASNVFSLKLDDIDDASDDKKLSWEKELLGLYITSHPFKDTYETLDGLVTPLNLLKNKREQNVRVAGVITNVQKVITKKGKVMNFVMIEDSIGSVELIIFPTTMERTLPVWQDENQVLVEGRVSDKDGQPKIIVENAQIITPDLLRNMTDRRLSEKKLWISLPADFTKEKMNDLKSALESSHGSTPVYLQINNGHTRKIRTNLRVIADKNLQDIVVKMLGENAWQLQDK